MHKTSRVEPAKLPAHFDYLLIPGFDGTGELFAPLIETRAFPSRPAVATYGRPMMPPGELARSQAKVPRAWERTVIIAESMGGIVAAELCDQLPVPPAALVLCAAFATAPRPLLLAVSELVPASLQRWCATSPALLGTFAFASDVRPAVLDLMRSANEQIDDADWRARMRALRSCNATRQLQALRAPACYLQAANDRLVPASASEQCCKLLANVMRIQIDAPHFLLQSAPVACVNAIAGFLGSVPSR